MIIKEYFSKFRIFYIPDGDIKTFGYINDRRENYTKKDLTYAESWTLACDGALASCSNHVMSIPTSTYLNSTSSSMSTIALPFSGFQLKVIKPKAKLMGVEKFLERKM